MKQIAALLLSSAAFITLSSAAHADPSVPDQSVAYSFGARAGGYEFRNTDDPSMGQWDDCRMDGAGVFGQRTLTRYLFAEVGFDLYTARDATPVEGMPAPMDRISGITTVAGGARVPWRWVQPYVQLGVGLEVTRVEMPEHDDSNSAAYPMGFLGVGAELWPTEHLSLGANVRTNLMKHFDHASDKMSGEFEAAGQGQLFLKYQI